MRFPRLSFLSLTSAFLLLSALRADDGYRLWLRYDLIQDTTMRQAYTGAFSEIVVPENPRPVIAAARDELVAGLRGLLGVDIPVVTKATRDNALILGTPRQPELLPLVNEADLRTANEEGYVLRRITTATGHQTIIVANRGGRSETEGPHPSYQAWSYAALLNGSYSSVSPKSTRLSLFAFRKL